MLTANQFDSFNLTRELKMPKKRKKAAKKTKKKAAKNTKKKAKRLKKLKKEKDSNLLIFTKNASHYKLYERRFFYSSNFRLDQQ